MYPGTSPPAENSYPSKWSTIGTGHDTKCETKYPPKTVGIHAKYKVEVVRNLSETLNAGNGSRKSNTIYMSVVNSRVRDPNVVVSIDSVPTMNLPTPIVTVPLASRGLENSPVTKVAPPGSKSLAAHGPGSRHSVARLSMDPPWRGKIDPHRTEPIATPYAEVSSHTQRNAGPLV